MYLHPTKPPNTGSLWVGLKRLLDNEEMHRRIYGCLSAFRSELKRSFPEFAVPEVVRRWDDFEPILVEFLLAARRQPGSR